MESKYLIEGRTSKNLNSYDTAWSLKHFTNLRDQELCRNNVRVLRGRTGYIVKTVSDKTAILRDVKYGEIAFNDYVVQLPLSENRREIFQNYFCMGKTVYFDIEVDNIGNVKCTSLWLSKKKAYNSNYANTVPISDSSKEKNLKDSVESVFPSVIETACNEKTLSRNTSEIKAVKGSIPSTVKTPSHSSSTALYYCITLRSRSGTIIRIESKKAAVFEDRVYGEVSFTNKVVIVPSDKSKSSFYNLFCVGNTVHYDLEVGNAGNVKCISLWFSKKKRSNLSCASLIEDTEHELSSIGSNASKVADLTSLPTGVLPNINSVDPNSALIAKETLDNTLFVPFRTGRIVKVVSDREAILRDIVYGDIFFTDKEVQFPFDEKVGNFHTYFEKDRIVNFDIEVGSEGNAKCSKLWILKEQESGLNYSTDHFISEKLEEVNVVEDTELNLYSTVNSVSENKDLNVVEDTEPDLIFNTLKSISEPLKGTNIEVEMEPCLNCAKFQLIPETVKGVSVVQDIESDFSCQYIESQLISEALKERRIIENRGPKLCPLKVSEVTTQIIPLPQLFSGDVEVPLDSKEENFKSYFPEGKDIYCETEMSSDENVKCRSFWSEEELNLNCAVAVSTSNSYTKANVEEEFNFVLNSDTSCITYDHMCEDIEFRNSSILNSLEKNVEASHNVLVLRGRTGCITEVLSDTVAVLKDGTYGNITFTRDVVELPLHEKRQSFRNYFHQGKIVHFDIEVYGAGNVKCIGVWAENRKKTNILVETRSGSIIKVLSDTVAVFLDKQYGEVTFTNDIFIFPKKEKGRSFKRYLSEGSLVHYDLEIDQAGNVKCLSLWVSKKHQLKSHIETGRTGSIVQVVSDTMAVVKDKLYGEFTFTENVVKFSNEKKKSFQNYFPEGKAVHYDIEISSTGNVKCLCLWVSKKQSDLCNAVVSTAFKAADPTNSRECGLTSISIHEETASRDTGWMSYSKSSWFQESNVPEVESFRDILALSNITEGSTPSEQEANDDFLSVLVLRGRTGTISRVLSDRAAILNDGIFGNITFTDAVVKFPMKGKESSFHTYFSEGREVYYDIEVDAEDSAKCVGIWLSKKKQPQYNNSVLMPFVFETRSTTLIEDMEYKGRVTEMRLPFAFVVEIEDYGIPVFVFNMAFKPTRNAQKLRRDEPISLYVTKGDTVYVTVFRNSNCMEFEWSAWDAWMEDDKIHESILNTEIAASKKKKKRSSKKKPVTEQKALIMTGKLTNVDFNTGKLQSADSGISVSFNSKCAYLFGVPLSRLRLDQIFSVGQELNFLPSEEAQGEASRVWFGSFDSSISDMRERMNCIIKYCKEKAIRDSSVWTTIAQELAKQRPSDERQREFEDDDEVDIKSIDDSKFSERNDANSTKKSYPVCTSSSPQNKLFSALQKQNESPERKFISITSTDIPISGATSNQNQTINITSNEDDITASKDSVIQNKVATDSTPAALNQNSTLSVDSTKQQNSIEKITQEATIPIDSVEQNKTTTTDKQSTKLSKSNMKQEEVTADIMTEIRNTRPIESSPENVKEQNENKCIITEGTSLFSDIRKQNKNTVILVKQNETTTTVTNQSCMPGPAESFSNSAHEITREITNSLEPIVVSEDMTKDSSEITSDSEKRNKSTDREQSTRIIHNFERTDASNSEGQEIPFSTNVLRTNNVQISEDEIPMSVLESRFDISVIDNNTMKNLELSLESVLRQQVGNVASSLAPHVIDIIKEDLRRYMVQDLMAKALSSVIETSLDPNCEGPSEEIKKIIVHEWKKEMVHVIQKQKAERENEFKSVLTRAKEYQERMKAICNVAAQNGKCTSKEKVIDYVGDGGDDDVSSSQGNCNDYFHPVTCHSEENQSNNMLTDIVQDFMQFQNDRRQNLTNICIDKEVQTVSTGKVLYLKCLNDV